jgi:putative chitinase
VITAQLQKIMPLAPYTWCDALCRTAPVWGINTPVREAAYVGQLAHESQQFREMEERLSYSIERLMIVWPKRFPSRDSALPYARNRVNLANKVYANRMGNGDEKSGDGFKYRGRGPIMLTGKDNYRLAGAGINYNLLLTPERMLEPMIGADVAGWYWQTHGLNELADEHVPADLSLAKYRLGQLPLDEIDDEHEITARINGAQIGFEARVKWIEAARAVLL